MSKAKREELTLVSRDAFAVVEPHVPRTVGCEDLPGLGDEPWLGREHGDERSPRFSFLEYSWLINPSSLSARLTVAAARCSAYAAR